ncbi:Hemolysin-type calcium-binding repeat-containing protein [Rhodovulum sp. ES.010]|uniref:calcium-binding protein n=1 Tax=Rhodovulum sp. ES.010 TaxID=1882821 RepID=UPI00092AC9FC|nr:calcium-binding protein [Rhodovulum sp. ES.010]SIO02359.1 Hemolysin-type calcium-binding repeat-containing protein [Rhodovulum sp. ES.010]
METLAIDVAFGSRVEGAETVTSDQFGGIQTGYGGFSRFDEQFQDLGLNHLRWPGGTLAETDVDVYGLDVPGLFDGTQLYTPNPDRDRPDLTDTLAYCVDQGLSFSMILPTVRYAADIEQGVADLQAFLGDLLSGRYGPLPEDFTLEIGNEYMAHAALAETPALYGQIAERFIQTIVTALESPAINPQGADLAIAVQIGRSAGDDAAIRDALSPESLAEIDSLVAHALPFNFGAIDKVESDPDADLRDFGEALWQNRADYVDAWEEAILNSGGNPDAVELYMSAVNIGKSVQDVDDANLNYQDYGLKAAGAYLEVFATYQSIGMDAAAIWGVAGKHFNAVSYESPDGMVLDPGGALLKLMADNIVGMELVDGFQANDRGDLAMTYAWESDEAAVVFVAANDIAADGVSVTLDLGVLEGASVLEAVRLSAVLAEETPPDVTGLDLMVYEEALLEDFVPQVSGNTVVFTLHSDHEVVMLHLEKAPPINVVEGTLAADMLYGTDGSDAITGFDGADKLFGEAGDDHLLGGAGDDVLRGATGDDLLEGAAGNDRLYAGAGDDEVSGGGGADLIEGHGGADILSGDAGDDEISGGTGADAILGGSGHDRLFGGAGDDVIEGAGGKDHISGEGGNDTLYGGSWKDRLYGGSGDDALYGGAGNDLLKGGDGADRLSGDAGNDRLFGGAGADVFVFAAAGFGADRIEDFELGLDVIDLSGLSSGLSWDAFATTCLTDSAEGVLIDVAGSAITLLGIDAADLGQGDFLL